MSEQAFDANIEQFVLEFDINSGNESPSESQTDLKAGETQALSESTPIAAPFMRNKGAKDTCVFSDHLISAADVECEVFDYVLYELEYKKSPYSLAIALALIVARKLSASATAAHQTQPSNSDYTRPVISSSALYKDSLKYLNEIITEWKANPELAVKAAKDYSNYPYLTAVNAIKNTRRKMEDRNIIIHDLNKLLQFNSPKQYSYYAIFDGHAGVDAASYSASHLHHNLVKSRAFLDGDINGAFKEAFSVTDLHYLERSAREGKKSGCTALCALLQRNQLNKLYIAWLGDSQAILVKNGKPIDVMIPHKPEREDERKRIEDLGGFVVFVDTWRVNGTLAVSRAIGDPEHKPYISSEPDITEIEFDGDEDFLILACDGLWDQLTPEEATSLVYEQVCENTSDNVEEVAESVVTNLSKTAKIEGSSDNITTIVIFFKELSALRSTPFEPLSPRTKSLPQSDYQQNGQFNGFNPLMYSMDSHNNYNNFSSQFETNQFDMSSNITPQWTSFSSDAMNTTKIEIDSVDLSSNNSNLSSNLNPFSDTTQFSQINIESENNISDLLEQPKNVVLETSFESEASGEYYSTIVSSSDLKNFPSDDQSHQFASFSDNTFVMQPNYTEIPVTEVDSSNVYTVNEVPFQSDYIDGITSFKENDEYGNYLTENQENISIPTIETVEANSNQSFSSNTEINEEVIDTTCVEDISMQSKTMFASDVDENNMPINIDHLSNDQQSFDFEYKNSQLLENNQNISVSDTTINQEILDVDPSQHNIDNDQPFSIVAEIVDNFDEMALTEVDSLNAKLDNFENVNVIDSKIDIEENVVSESEPLSILTVDNVANPVANEKVILETNLDSFNTETIEVPEFSDQMELNSESSILIHDSTSNIQDTNEPTIEEQSIEISNEILIPETELEFERELHARNLLFGNDEPFDESFTQPVIESIAEPITETEQNIDQTDNLIIVNNQQDISIPFTDNLIVEKPIEEPVIIIPSIEYVLKPNEEINDLMSKQINDSFSSEQSVDQTNLHSTTDASFNDSSLQLIDENDLKGDIVSVNEIASEAINEFEKSCKHPFDANESASKQETVAVVTESIIQNIENTVTQNTAFEQTDKLELISKITELKTNVKTDSLKTTTKTTSSTTAAKTTTSNKTVAASKSKPSSTMSSAASKSTAAANRPKTTSAATSRVTSTKPVVNSTIAAKHPITAKPKIETRLTASRPATTAAPAKPLAPRTAATKPPEIKTANTKPIALKPTAAATRVAASKVATSRINTGRTTTTNTTHASASASTSAANPVANKTSVSNLTRKPVVSTVPSRPKLTPTNTTAASKGTVSASAVNGNSAKTATSTLKTVKSKIDTGRASTSSSTKSTPTLPNQSNEKKSIVTSRSVAKPLEDKSPQRESKTIVQAKPINASKPGVTNNFSPKLRKSNPLNVPKPLKQELEDAVLLSKPRSEDLSSFNGSQSTPDTAEKAFLMSKSESLGLSPFNNSNGHTSSYESPVFEPNINSNGLSN